MPSAESTPSMATVEGSLLWSIRTVISVPNGQFSVTPAINFEHVTLIEVLSTTFSFCTSRTCSYWCLGLGYFWWSLINPLTSSWHVSSTKRLSQNFLTKLLGLPWGFHVQIPIFDLSALLYYSLFRAFVTGNHVRVSAFFIFVHFQNSFCNTVYV